MGERTWLLYVHTNKINNKKYVGITSMLPNERWCNGNGYKGQKFYNAIKKYGWDNFDHEIIVEGLTEVEADYWERLYIKGLNTKIPYGYNVTDGGDAKCLDRSGFVGVNATNIKPLICLNTLEIFPYQKLALEKYSIFSSAMSQCLNGRALSAGKLSNGEKLLWAHYDNAYDIEHYINLREEIKLRIKNHANKFKAKIPTKVICLNTNEIFETIESAKEKYSTKAISQSCRKGCASGKDENGNRLYWMYYEDYIDKIKNEREVV